MSAEQPEKQSFPNDVTDVGILIDVSTEQPEKHPFKDVTDVGIIMDVSPEQSEKQ